MRMGGWTEGQTDRHVRLSTWQLGAGPRNRDTFPGTDRRLFCSIQRPDWFCGPLSLLFYVHWWELPRGGGVKRPKCEHLPTSNTWVKNQCSRKANPASDFIDCTGANLHNKIK